MGPEYVWDGEVPSSAYPPTTTPMQQNDHAIAITPATETAILAKAEELRVLIEAFTLSLIDEERSAYFKLGDARLALDQKCDDYMHQNLTLVPTGISLSEYDKDGANIAALDRILAKIATITDRFTDTAPSPAPTASTPTSSSTTTSISPPGPAPPEPTPSTTTKGQLPRWPPAQRHPARHSPDPVTARSKRHHPRSFGHIRRRKTSLPRSPHIPRAFSAPGIPIFDRGISKKHIPRSISDRETQRNDHA